MESVLAIFIMWLSIIWVNFDPLRSQVIFGIWGFCAAFILGIFWFVCFVLPSVEVAKGFPLVVIG
jgi:predicted exporter